MSKRIFGLAFILLLFLSLLVPTQTIAQTEDDPGWISVSLGHSEYRGDFAHEFFSFDVPKDFGFGLSYMRYLNRSFNLDITGFYGHLDDDYSQSFSKNMALGNLMAQYKLANGSILSKDARFRPYLMAGVGFASFWGGTESVPDNNAFLLPMGLGFDIPLSNNVHLNWKTTYNRSFSDYVDSKQGATDIDGRNHDDIMIHSIGLKFNISGASDRDQDGVRDKNDRCPDVMGSPETDGCPDADADMVIDSEDACPNTAGLAEFGGCPDTDSDGIVDAEDQCPETAGSSDMNGCADSDSDGIADPVDACPATIGTDSANGCPDADGDGLEDSSDQCPNIKGSKDTNGCPDQDMDNVLDSEDLCPKLSGTRENDGCPEITKNLKEAVALIADNLDFELDNARVTPDSRNELDKLVDLMNENKALLLRIEGHTDSIGPEEYNERLSRRRAYAIKDYLVRHGVASSRITAEGYGESEPIATNQTEDGRAQNRRVDLIVSYEK